MEIFETCNIINDLHENGNESQAREALVKLLEYMKENEKPLTPLVNRLIRNSGLFPYLKPESSIWEDRYVFESFKVDVGLSEPVILHREQSSVLRKLLEGRSIAISAPTSFGKSFILDAYISIKRPKNIMIIVPTIALTDETRRRLYPKFSKEYKIITTGDVELVEKNIFIFPQERAIGYEDKIADLDLLVIDEFYKAGFSFDKERSPALLRAILKFTQIAKQRYFLAPNISSLNDNIFTQGMDFIPINFNTVYLEKHELWTDMQKNEGKKADFVKKLLSNDPGKTLIYAASYSNIKTLSTLFIDGFKPKANPILDKFEEWLGKNYSPNWQLAKLVKRGFGVHNGQLHRPLSQLQIKLFEANKGIDTLISTSSIIEGVNTSARNIIVWSNKKGGPGNPRLDDFTFKNIIGRGGRMFKHFVGKIYILEAPPTATETPLDLPIPDALLGNISDEGHLSTLTSEQLAKLHAYNEDMRDILGVQGFEDFKVSANILTTDHEFLHKLAVSMARNPQEWNGLNYLNSADPAHWEHFLYKAINLRPSIWGAKFGSLVKAAQVLSNNWVRTVPEILDELSDYDIGIED